MVKVNVLDLFGALYGLDLVFHLNILDLSLDTITCANDPRETRGS